MSVMLGAAGCEPQARLNGFKSRALQAMPKTAQRHLYVTEWRTFDRQDGGAGAPMLVITDNDALPSGCERLRSAALAEEMTARLSSASSSVVAAAVAIQRGQMELDALCSLAVALALVQAQASKAIAPVVWLLTAGAQELERIHHSAHVGEWGLARSARAEMQLPVVCVDGALADAQKHGVPTDEYELVVRAKTWSVPRLTHLSRVEEPSAAGSRVAGAHPLEPR